MYNILLYMIYMIYTRIYTLLNIKLKEIITDIAQLEPTSES